MVIEAIRRLLGKTEASPHHALEYGEGIDYDEVIARLHMAKSEVDRIKDQIMNEISEHQERMIEAFKKGDRDTAETTAAEIVIKKKVLRSIIAYSKLIGLAIQRIRDARNIEALVKALVPIEYAMRIVNDYLANVSPEALAKLTQALGAAETLVRHTGMIAESLPVVRSIADLDPEVREELIKAMAEAKRESDELIPRVVVEEPRGLEERLLDYIKRHGGVINVRQASKELGVPPSKIKEALYSLDAKGVIRIAGKNQASKS